MKTSNILLILLLSVTLLFGFSSNLVLKAEFEKINKSDRFHGYNKESLRPFKYITLGGKSFGITQIQSGDHFEIRSAVNRELIDWKIVQDTLKVIYRRNWSMQGFNPPDPFRGRPNLYITLPKLAGISSDGVTSILSDLRLDSIRLQQKGNRLLLRNNQIGTLSANLAGQGHITIDGSNKIATAVVAALDSSNMVVEKDIFKDFRLTADSSAIISLPGGLLRKITRNQ